MQSQVGQTPDLNYKDDVQDHLEYLPKGFRNPQDFFKIFSNSPDFTDDSHAWFRNRVLTMLDNHDQIRKGNMKARFCANDNGTPSSVLSALGFNLCTLGIPCIYYGTEQSFDGRGFDDSGNSLSTTVGSGSQCSAATSEPSEQRICTSSTTRAVSIKASKKSARSARPLQRFDMACSIILRYPRRMMGIISGFQRNMMVDR